MKLLTKKIAETIPALYAQDGKRTKRWFMQNTSRLIQTGHGMF